MEVKKRLEYFLTGVPHYGTLEFSRIIPSGWNLDKALDNAHEAGCQVQSLGHALVAAVAFEQPKLNAQMGTSTPTAQIGTSTLCLTYFRDGFKHAFVEIDSSAKSAGFLRRRNPVFDKREYDDAIFDYLVSCAEKSGRVVHARFECDGVKIGQHVTSETARIWSNGMFVFEGQAVSAAIGNKEVEHFYAKHLLDKGITSVRFGYPYRLFRDGGAHCTSNRDIKDVSCLSLVDRVGTIYCGEHCDNYRTVIDPKTNFVSPNPALVPQPATSNP